jgi:hypothetical protein
LGVFDHLGAEDAVGSVAVAFHFDDEASEFLVLEVGHGLLGDFEDDGLPLVLAGLVVEAPALGGRVTFPSGVSIGAVGAFFVEVGSERPRGPRLGSQ